MLARSLQDIDNDVDNQGTSSKSLLQALTAYAFLLWPWYSLRSNPLLLNMTSYLNF